MGDRKRRVYAACTTVRGALTGDNSTYAGFSRCTERSALRPVSGRAKDVARESIMWQSLLELLEPIGMAPRRL